MTKICENCRHYFQPFVEKSFDDAVCGSPAVQAIDDPQNESHFAPMIANARDICNREGDGIFVHFEPKTPTAGATFEAGPQPVFCSKQCGFADEFEPDELGLNFFQAIGTCPICSADTVYKDGTPTKTVVEYAFAAGGAA